MLVGGEQALVGAIALLLIAVVGVPAAESAAASAAEEVEEGAYEGSGHNAHGGESPRDLALGVKEGVVAFDRRHSSRGGDLGGATQ